MSHQEATRLVWYFDFVSPYAYLQFEAYPELMQTAELRPVLFAGLLNHWGGKGPAEVPAKEPTEVGGETGRGGRTAKVVGDRGPELRPGRVGTRDRVGGMGPDDLPVRPAEKGKKGLEGFQFVLAPAEGEVPDLRPVSPAARGPEGDQVPPVRLVHRRPVVRASAVPVDRLGEDPEHPPEVRVHVRDRRGIGRERWIPSVHEESGLGNDPERPGPGREPPGEAPLPSVRADQRGLAEAVGDEESGAHGLLHRTRFPVGIPGAVDLVRRFQRGERPAGQIPVLPTVAALRRVRVLAHPEARGRILDPGA